jgi:hypothetical protein
MELSKGHNWDKLNGAHLRKLRSHRSFVTRCIYSRSFAICGNFSLEWLPPRLFSPMRLCNPHTIINFDRETLYNLTPKGPTISV